jgi:hypothetical protein
MDLWREIAAQGYPGSYRMVYRLSSNVENHATGDDNRNPASAAVSFKGGHLVGRRVASRISMNRNRTI